MKTKTHHNVKVAKNRSKKAWVESLMRGRIAIQNHPTKLRLRRMSLPKTQTAVAKKLGASISTYCNIEKGGRTVTKENAEKIASIMGSTVYHLFSYDEKSERYRAAPQKKVVNQ